MSANLPVRTKEAVIAKLKTMGIKNPAQMTMEQFYKAWDAVSGITAKDMARFLRSKKKGLAQIATAWMVYDEVSDGYTEHGLWGAGGNALYYGTIGRWF